MLASCCVVSGRVTPDPGFFSTAKINSIYRCCTTVKHRERNPRTSVVLPNPRTDSLAVYPMGIVGGSVTRPCQLDYEFATNRLSDSLSGRCFNQTILEFRL